MPCVRVNANSLHQTLYFSPLVEALLETPSPPHIVTALVLPLEELQNIDSGSVLRQTPLEGRLLPLERERRFNVDVKCVSV